MTELLSLPDLPADQVGSAQVLVAAAGSGGSVAYKVALASYLSAAGAAATYASLASPSLRGVPTAPTAATGTNTTQIATTAFVTGAVAGLTGAVTPASPPASLAVLSSNDVIQALGFAPYSAANPAGYQTAANVTATLGSYLPSVMAASTYQPVLGFTPYNATNPSGYQTAAQVTTALSGYATTSSVDSRVAALINAAPAALDTLSEIATQLISDENAAAALTLAVAGKVSAATAAATYLTIAGASTLYQPVMGYTAYDAANPAGYQTAASVASTLGAYLTSASAATTYQRLIGFTPYNNTNPAGYIAASGAPVQTVAGRTGAVVLAVGDVSGAYANSNPAGYQTAGQVSTALSGYATTAFVDGRVAALINAAPAALDTLGEIATQLASDESAAAALTTSVAGKLSKAANLADLASAAAARGNLGLAAVASSGAYADLAGTPAGYTLPVASLTVLGGVKVDGTTVTIAGGVISAAGGGGATSVPVTTVAASGTTQTLAAPASGSKAYDITLTGDCTLTLSGGTAGQQQTITAYLRQGGTGGRAVVLPAGVRWPSGVIPTPGTAAGGIDVFVFTTPDAGATWFGSY